MTGDLVAFLRARLDERAARAIAAAEKAGNEDWRFRPGDAYVSAVETNEDAPPATREHWMPLVTEAQSYIGDTLDDEIGQFIADNDPARVLADIDAKRQIVKQHQPVGYGGVCLSLCHTRAPGQPQTWPCLTLRLLAVPYADHPDYREKWRP
jgi:hypothetical protein